MSTLAGPSGGYMLRHLRAIQRDPLAFLATCARAYGDVVPFPIGKWPVFLVNHPDGAQQILQDHHRQYSKDTLQFTTLALVTGQGLLVSDGAFWLRQRRMLQPAFHRQQVTQWGGAITAAAERLVARWATLAPHRVVDVDAAMMQLTLEIVGHTLFSTDLSASAAELVRAVLTALDYIIYRAQTPLAPPLSWPTPRNRHVRRALHTLDEAVYRLLAARRAQPLTPTTPDVLDMLLQARDDSGQAMTDQQVRDEMITLIIAGHETVASALTWTWHLLGQHPDAQQRLENELAQVLNGRAPTVNDLPQLVYTRQVFDEALRLYPPAWLITRKALTADTVLGHPISAGALIILSPYLLQRHPAVWPEPERFWPERFAEAAPRYAYIPFGGGPRLCIGQTFALTEGPLILATLAQCFRLHALPNHVVRADPLVTIRPQGGLPMRLEPRA